MKPKIGGLANRAPQTTNFVTYPHNRVQVPNILQIDSPEFNHILRSAKAHLFRRWVSVCEDAVEFDGRRIRQSMSEEHRPGRWLRQIQLRKLRKVGPECVDESVDGLERRPERLRLPCLHI